MPPIQRPLPVQLCGRLWIVRKSRAPIHPDKIHPEEEHHPPPVPSNPQAVTNVTDVGYVRERQSRRHDFAERNAEKLVVGAVAGHCSMGRVGTEMPCPDGAHAAAHDLFRNPGNVVGLWPKGPAFHALLPIAPPVA